MAEIIGEFAGHILLEAIASDLKEEARSNRSQIRSTKSISSTQKLAESSAVQQAHAGLVASSNITFGNDCKRLVNIAFQTSKAFPSMMGTYADVSQYLRKELAKHYPDEYFHIIIGENQNFGASIDNVQYFTEIEEDRYRVLIFTTNRNSHTALVMHDANSQRLFVWN